MLLVHVTLSTDIWTKQLILFLHQFNLYFYLQNINEQ